MVKGETVMPTPQGDITSTDTWSAPVEEVLPVEEVVEEMEDENVKVAE